MSNASVPSSSAAPADTTAGAGEPAAPAPSVTGGQGPRASAISEEAQLVLDDCQDESCLGTGTGPDPGTELPPDCGDGELTEDEACDDGNRESGDGCVASCLATEPGFSCAAPGRPCQAISRCGDGLVSASEPCDDGNQVSGDGCSDRCRVEPGKKCEGQPSVCTDAVCGDGLTEGAEACDDGNDRPFDGCSRSCEREPSCEGTSCTSDCGDGIVINEACDDGNRLDGDGCSSSCEVESGFECVEQSAACEILADQCVLRVPVIFRDFSDEHEDFGDHPCNDLVLGAVSPTLNADGLPTLSGELTAEACLSSDENLAEWYTDSDNSLTVVSELVLFDNGAGGYVNRYGAEGQRFEAVTSERNGGDTLEECEETCVTVARSGQVPMFDGPLRCEDVCAPAEQAQLTALQDDLEEASDATPPNQQLIAEIEADIAAVEQQIAEQAATIEVCEADCALELDARVEACVATCTPCSTDPESYCIGGETQSFDGTPLFFPLDSVEGVTANSERALIPSQYGYANWPWEEEIFPDAPNHNFFFTSEVRHWFRYDESTNATLNFLGDDDVWVFINGQLAVDLGGVHEPSEGSVTIDATTSTVTSRSFGGNIDTSNEASTDAFGLVPGNVYEVVIFHAERQLAGSSFKLTLGGFEAEPSDCTAICGDGVLSFGEECDDGDNDGGYGECGVGCILGPFCGDGIVQADFGEDCDDGPEGSVACPGCRKLRVRVR